MSDFTLSPSDAQRLQRVAEQVGTPFYLYDAARLRARVAALRAALPQAEFFYSLKANPNLSVVSTLTQEGPGAEVCSRLELETALAAGVVPARILMVGPGKSQEELRRAVQLGLKAIVAESLEELRDIDRIAADEGRHQPVALRINPDFTVTGARLTMSGKATQFGIEQTDLTQALALLAKLPHLRLAGLHVYMGTRILSAETLAANTRQVLALAEEIINEAAMPLEFVDVGGGFGVPYSDKETALDLEEVGAALRPLIAAFRDKYCDTHVAIELGRFMVAEAGLFCTRVLRRKTSKGEHFAVCDGGSNVHAAAAGQGFMRRNFPISLIPQTPAMQHAPVARWSVTGPLCTPMDVIAAGVDLADPQPGDLICIHQSGAYGPSHSPVNFLGFGTPAEVMADGDRLTLVQAAPDWRQRLRAQAPQLLPAADDIAAQAPATPGPFGSGMLDELWGLKGLCEEVGGQLESDPDAWGLLWQNPLLRALTTIGVPAAYNGFPLSETSLGLEDCPYDLHVAIIERLARFDASCIMALPGPSLSGGAVLAAGSEAQIARFFRAYRDGPQGTFFAVTEPEVGSDASAGQTRLDSAADGRMSLSGSKMLVGNIARAQIGLVFARRSDTGRPALVMLDLAEAGSRVEITRLPTTGLRGADLCRIDMKDVAVTPEMVLGSDAAGTAGLRDGFMAINGVFERNRPVVAALALGNARGMLDRLKQAGALGFEDAEGSYRALLSRLAAVLHDYMQGRPRAHRVSEIKVQAVAFSDALVARIGAEAPDAMLSDALLRRKMRDAKAFEYMEGTSNINLMAAFRAYLAEVRA
ncbi:acyl-CoA dehydrogenase family protein [Phaeobacter sp. HF9A]|uniref:acyl-CoA dehydrogenase family protein n=1 Tax=Phaeobacter sp. HF9A TaxID=2721561 RepID=UPI00142F4B90|nr:acyl-CoA dehydrogenase family protein [Phaeobacter sp. HF9A]NIZ12596.1 diaminopimelate decarboxylase [Phaeobacter sp. HF9A]